MSKPGEKQTSAEDSDTDPDEDEDAMMELRTLVGDLDFSERLGDRFVADRKDRIIVASQFLRDVLTGAPIASQTAARHDLSQRRNQRVRLGWRTSIGRSSEQVNHSSHSL